MVGDEDQSIYSWRGAEISNILDFEHDFPGARVLRLEENYRSTQAILDAASALVAHNRRRKGKTLRATKAGGDPVALYEASDEFDEASFVVGEIAARRERRAAVLFRMNAQSRLFEEALLQRRIAYVVVGGVGFYERKEVKDVLAYLRLVANPEDAVAFRRVLNVPPRGIGARTVEELERRRRRAPGLPRGRPRRAGGRGPRPRPGQPAPPPLPRDAPGLPRGRGPPRPQGAARAHPRRHRLLGRARRGGHPGEPGSPGEPGRAALRRRRLRSGRGGAHPGRASSTGRRSSPTPTR